MPAQTAPSKSPRCAALFGFAIAAIFGTTSAEAAVVVWQGEAVIDSASGNCSVDAAIGPAASRVVKSVLRPKNIDENGANTTIMFIANQTTMFAMVLDKGAMPAGTAATFGNDASGVIKTNVGVAYKNFVQTPQVISQATENVTLQGTIKDFLYVSGCTVTFRAAYNKRAD